MSTYLPKSTTFVPAGTDLGVKLLMRGIHDVGTSGLSQIVELADHRPIIEVEIKCRFFLEGMQTQGDLGWNRFGHGVLEPDVFNDGINQGTLCKFIGTISKLLDADST